MPSNFFDIVKHYATVLRSHFGWVSMHVADDGDSIVYREKSGTSHGVEYASPERTMAASQVIAAGQILEKRRRHD